LNVEEVVRCGTGGEVAGEALRRRADDQWRIQVAGVVGHRDEGRIEVFDPV
jgi:hypothetical protein